MSTPDDLIARREKAARELAELDAQIQEIKQSEKQSAIEEIRNKILAASLSIEDIFPGAVIRQAGPVKKTRAAVVPKYRNPSTGETWSGRGKNPRWMAEFIAAGKTPEDFKI